MKKIKCLTYDPFDSEIYTNNKCNRSVYLEEWLMRTKHIKFKIGIDEDEILKFFNTDKVRDLLTIIDEDYDPNFPNNGSQDSDEAWETISSLISQQFNAIVEG